MKCLRIYAPRMGSSHFGDADIPTTTMPLFPNEAAFQPLSCVAYPFRACSSRCSRSGLAYPARTSAAVWLDGIVEFETSDGELRRVSAGMRSWWRIHMEGAYLTASRRGAESVILVTLPHGLDSPEFN